MAKKMSINILGAILMIVLLVLMFSPYWQLGGSEGSISIQKYIWFPKDQKALQSYIDDQLGVKKFDVTSIVLMPVLTMVLCAFGVVLSCIKRRSSWVAIFPTAAGLIGLLGYLSHDVFKLGAGWILHLIVCIAVFVAGLYGLAYGLFIYRHDQVLEKCQSTVEDIDRRLAGIEKAQSRLTGLEGVGKRLNVLDSMDARLTNLENMMERVTARPWAEAPAEAACEEQTLAAEEAPVDQFQAPAEDLPEAEESAFAFPAVNDDSQLWKMADEAETAEAPVTRAPLFDEEAPAEEAAEPEAPTDCAEEAAEPEAPVDCPEETAEPEESAEDAVNEDALFDNLRETMRQSLLSAQRVADGVVADARQQAQKTVDDAQHEADNMLTTARADAYTMVSDARSEADRITAEARTNVEEMEQRLESLKASAASFKEDFSRMLSEQTEAFKNNIGLL